MIRPIPCPAQWIRLTSLLLAFPKTGSAQAATDGKGEGIIVSIFKNLFEAADFSLEFTVAKGTSIQVTFFRRNARDPVAGMTSAPELISELSIGLKLGALALLG